MNKYVCSICGSEYDFDELEAYVYCVTKCSNEVKQKEEEEKERKRLEELNDALTKVQEAKELFERQLNEFKEKYPEEYELNFAAEKDCCDDKKTCGGTCGGCKDTNTCNDCVNDWLNEFLDDDKKYSSLEITYKNDGKNTPEVSASINGKKLDDNSLQKLFEDPDTQHLAKMLEIW